MSPGKIYPSRIMLAGEYGALVGGCALTIPFTTFNARVRNINDIPPGKESEARKSVNGLNDLFLYIRDLPDGSFHASPDPSLFSGHIKDFWLDMTIPAGYGLGSSGAVSAAIYDLFFPDAEKATLVQQKEDLATIGSYFHGKSQGMDALTSHAATSLQFKEDGTVQKVAFDPSQIPSGYRFFLLNSGERFDTAPLQEHFLNLMKERGFESSVRNEYLVINKKLIESLLGERDADPGLLVRVLSDYQFTHFRKMIPKKMVDLWIEGQVSNEYYLKLHGNGGGYLLGLTHHSSMHSLTERWKEKLLWLE